MRIRKGATVMSQRIFLHGLESSNQSTKAVFFRERYPDMLIPNFQGPFRARMERLEEILAGRSDLVITGSSYGGLMGAVFAMENEERVKRLVLLAPAINLPEFEAYRTRTIDIPVRIFHGRKDPVIPIAQIEPIARKCFRDLEFHPVEDDHFLHRTFKTLDWDRLLA
ncbi:MAG: dienelactone hydrolase family protein [Deltaproteobacteria bacterium]|nr:dienelactone hydrolase family protein [Deltaproteobacteria bacterium]